MNDLDSGSIKKDVDVFQVAVQKLSGEISKASSLWNDSQFNSLSSAISVIAGMSKDVIITGERCCDSIEKYKKISEEEY